MTPSRSVTLGDIAREVGVHVSTVSKVLNRSAISVRPETRARILESAEQMRYRPNAIARGLKLATTGAIGLLVPSLRNPVYAEIIRGAFGRAWERRFVVLLAEDSGGGEAPVAYERLVDEGRIDGMLVASARAGHPMPEQWRDAHVPCVFVNRRGPDGGHNVVMREEDAGRLAADHLLSLGHRRLAHLAGPEDLDTARRRTEGFVEQARSAGVEPLVLHAEFDERAGHDVMRELLSGDPRPTAVFVSNLTQALGAVAGAQNSGCSIPGDVSVVACDDDPVADYLAVPLTSIRMPLFELGATGVDAIIDRIEGKPVRDVVIETAPELVHRRSTIAI